MSSLSPPSTTHPQRAPPPSLFLGPPSRNASNLSLSSLAPHPAPASSKTQSQQQQQQPRRASLLRTRSARQTDPSSSTNTTTTSQARPSLPPPSKTEGNRTDALWAEMQATLADVEVSAFHSTHVFGPAHSAALEELRAAQVELAGAWKRGGVVDGEDEDWGAREREKGQEDGGEEDIVVARRRREANERFIGRVKGRVDDVVGKLEGVAGAMRKVERESREIWSESESVRSGSGST